MKHKRYDTRLTTAAKFQTYIAGCSRLLNVAENNIQYSVGRGDVVGQSLFKIKIIHLYIIHY